MNTSPTLLILAAGIGSRYGDLKQTHGFGPNNETLMEYSIFDAIKVGFKKIVFIIREDFSEKFENKFNNLLKNQVAVEYIYQSLDLSKYGIFKKILKREKPWGTAHAILEARDCIKEPFCMINADDFYGRDAFATMYNFLKKDASPKDFSLVAYKLNKTLSSEGTVSRGVCKISDNNHLVEIKEMTNISKNDNGVIFNLENEAPPIPLESDCPVSMNFFGFHPILFKYLEEKLKIFFEKNSSNLKAEFLIPPVIQEMIGDGHINVKALYADTTWFGVTYKKDDDNVRKSLQKLIDKGKYPNYLWS